MGKELSTKTSSNIAPAVDLPVARELAYWLSGMVNGAIEGDMPAVVRSRFTHRAAVLRQACEPAARSDLEEVVAGLMVRYPSMRGLSKIEASVLARAFADDLAGVPLWAITAAIADIAKGVVSDVHPDFAPSAPRLRQLAQEHLERPTKEMLDLKKVLTAPTVPPADPEMRRRVSEGLEFLKQQMPPRQTSIYRAPAEAPGKQAMPVDQLMEHYRTHNLGFEPKPKSEDAA